MKRRLGLVTGFLAVAAGIPHGAAGQTCTLSATIGMAVPTHGMDLGSGMDSPLFIGGYSGLGFACGSTSARVGLDFEGYALSYSGHQLWSSSGNRVGISGLLGRVEREFPLGDGARAPWIVVVGRAGPIEYRARSSRHTGVAAGAGVRLGLRFARPWSVFLHLGIRTNRIPLDTGRTQMVTALPMGVGVRFDP